jgi:DEAD/DEAH box helicase domain-containing protein
MREGVEIADSDGCYRCIRTYHLQYNAANISRERAIPLLRSLILAGEKRVPRKALEEIKPDSLFGSVLEKKFVDRLREYVAEKQGTWEQTVIKGKAGFRFALPGAVRLWDLELQPALGVAHGVMIQSQPDFLLTSDDERIKPMAIFTDGFAYHCHPKNRIADDLRKRRAILESGNFRVWSVTWEDLGPDAKNSNMVCHEPVASLLAKWAVSRKGNGQAVPDTSRAVQNGFVQFLTYLDYPVDEGWREMASFAAFWPLQLLMQKRTATVEELQKSLRAWQKGAKMPVLPGTTDGTWVFNDRAALADDLVAVISTDDILGNRLRNVAILARLGDSVEEVAVSGYCERWRRFLACMNFYQFTDRFDVWAVSECSSGHQPASPMAASSIPEGWQTILQSVASSVQPLAQTMAMAELPPPEVEFYADGLEDEAFAEMAWPALSKPVALLVGDEASFASNWEALGWTVVTPADIHAKGIDWMISEIRARMKGI